LGREDAGLTAWLKGILGSLDGLREEEGMTYEFSAEGFEKMEEGLE